jgi:thiol:disulfide interchange protein DsbD
LENDMKVAFTRAGLTALAGLALHGAALAQTPDQAFGLGGDTVSWTVQPADNVKQGSRLAITLRGAVQEGWHVYALKQLPEGPTPLRVTLDPGAVATADGAPVGSAPSKIHDPAFDLETQFYAKAFTVTVPVRIGSHLAAGKQLIPVNVRFQTCNGRICQPPKTVRLSAPVTVRAEG